MKKHGKKTARLGDLIAAVFDEAGRFSADPREIARLAAQAMDHLLRRPQMVPVPIAAH
jgi:hypothetical protein